MPDQPRTIVRPDKHGAPDDVVVEAVSCFRLERMNKRAFWAACYRGDDRISFWISADKKGRITVAIQEDNLGAVDDADETEAQIAAMLAAANG